MDESLDLFLVKYSDSLQNLYNNIQNYISDNNFNILDRNLKFDREFKINNFLELIYNNINIEDPNKHSESEEDENYIYDDY